MEISPIFSQNFRVSKVPKGYYSGNFYQMIVAETPSHSKGKLDLLSYYLCLHMLYLSKYLCTKLIIKIEL